MIQGALGQYVIIKKTDNLRRLITLLIRSQFHYVKTQNFKNSRRKSHQPTSLGVLREADCLILLLYDKMLKTVYVINGVNSSSLKLVDTK